MNLADMPFEEIKYGLKVRTLSGTIGTLFAKIDSSFPNENEVKILWPDESVSTFWHHWTTHLEVMDGLSDQPEL